MNGLQRVGVDTRVKVLGGHGLHGTRHVLALGGAVAHYHHFFEGLHVVGHRHVDRGLVADGDFLGRETNVAENECGCWGGGHGVVALHVGVGTLRGTFDLDGHAGKAARGIGNFTRHGVVLGIGRSGQKKEHKLENKRIFRQAKRSLFGGKGAEIVIRTIASQSKA